MTELDRAYANCLQRILSDGIEETNERTGVKVKALPGVHFSCTVGFPLLTLRKIPIRIFVAEQIWFLSGSRRPDSFLDSYTRIWDEFTNINGVVGTAYGYRWRHHFGRDQIEGLISLLESESSSRHGVVVAWDPASDGLDTRPRRKNIPCPFAFTVNIIGGKLHFHNLVRSNDMLLGFPHDVAGFALLQRMLASHLGVGVGQYSHSISNAHIYEPHYAAAQQLVDSTGQASEIELTARPDWLRRAMAGDESLFHEIVGELESNYTADQQLKGLKLVL
jgi:thymidylate synthase